MERPIAQDDLVQVELRRSGFVDWNYLAGGGDGLIEKIRLIRKIRYRRKRFALADVERQLREGRAAVKRRT